MEGATMIPATTKSLTLNPAPLADEGLSEQTCEKVARYAAPPAGVLEHRLRELDREWDVERLTATVWGLVLLGAVLLVLLLGAGWLVLPVVVAACLLLHGLVGWTPARPLLRRLGYRTPQEVARERFALKAMRGDCQPESLVTTPQDREDLARFEDEGGPPAEVPQPDVSAPVVGEALRATRC
jgi:hypothetical protein